VVRPVIRTYYRLALGIQLAITFAVLPQFLVKESQVTHTAPPGVGRPGVWWSARVWLAANGIRQAVLCPGL